MKTQEFNLIRDRYEQFKKDHDINVIMAAISGIRNQLISEIKAAVFEGKELPKTKPYLEVYKHILSPILDIPSDHIVARLFLHPFRGQVDNEDTLLEDALMFGISVFNTENHESLILMLQENASCFRFTASFPKDNATKINELPESLTKIIITRDTFELDDIIREGDTSDYESKPNISLN